MLMVVCIVGGGYRFLIDPMIDKVDTNTKARYALYEERQVIDRQIGQMDELQEIYVTNTQTLEELQEVMGPYLTDENFERELRYMGEEYDVGILNIAIENEAVEYVDETTTEITAKAANMTLYGGIQDCLDFIKYLNDQEKVIIINFSLGMSEGIEESYRTGYGVYSEASYSLYVVQYMESEHPQRLEETESEEGEATEDEELISE